MSQDGILYKILDRFIGADLQMVDFLGQFMHLAKKNFEPGTVYNLHELCFVKRKPSDSGDGEVLQFFDEKLEIIEEIVLEDRATERLRVNEFLSFDGDGESSPEIEISPKVSAFFNDVLSLNDPGFVKKGGGRLSRILLEEDKKSERYTDRPDIPLFEDSEDGFQKVNPLSRAFEEEEDLTIKSSYNDEPDLFSDLGIHPEKETDEPVTPDFLNSEEEEVVFTHSSIVIPDDEDDDEETYSIFSGGIKVTPVTEEDESPKKEVTDNNEVADFLESLVAVPEPPLEVVDEVGDEDIIDVSGEYSIETTEIAEIEDELPESVEEVEMADELPEPVEEVEMEDELPEPIDEFEIEDENDETIGASLPHEEIDEVDELIDHIEEMEQQVDLSEGVAELNEVEIAEFNSEIQELTEEVKEFEVARDEEIVESEDIPQKKQRISIFADIDDITDEPEVETSDESEIPAAADDVVSLVNEEIAPEEVAEVDEVTEVNLEIEEIVESESDQDIHSEPEEALEADIQHDIILPEIESELKESSETVPEVIDGSLEEEAQIIPDEIETIETGSVDPIEVRDEIDSVNELIQPGEEIVIEPEKVVEAETEEDKLMFDESFFDGVIEIPEESASPVAGDVPSSEPEPTELPGEEEPKVADRKEEAEPELIDIPLYDEATVPDAPPPFKHLDEHGEIEGRESGNTGDNLTDTQIPIVEMTEYISTNENEESNQPPLIQDQDDGNTVKDESRVMEEETEPPKSQLSVLIKMLIVLAVIIATYFILQASGYLRGKNAVKTDENLAQGALVIVDSNLLADNREYPFNKDTQNDVNIKGAAFKDGRYFEVEENGTLNPVLYDTSTEKTYKVFVPFDSAAVKEEKKAKKDDKSKKEVDKKPVKKADDNSNSGNITLQDAVKNKVKETKIADFIFKSGKKYYVQISAHRAFDTAEKLAKELKKKGYKSFVMKIKKSGVAGEEGVWYRVRVGPFDKEEKAREVNNTLNPKLKK
jgi:cell division septation protein DedD